MNPLLGTVLLLLVLPGAARGQEICAALGRGDGRHQCCNVTVEQEERGDRTLSPDLPRRCPELGRSGSPACACLRGRWLRLLQVVGPVLHGHLAGVKVLLLNVSRAVTRDVLIAFSPTEHPRMLNVTEKGKAGKIHLPREIFRSLSSQTVSVVVTVLNIPQLGMFQEVNQTGQVLDDTVVGITVGETSISGLRDPVQLTFTHGQLPHGITPRCVFWDPSKGQAGGWSSSGCDTQLLDKGTHCSCDHLTFFTLLLNPALDGSTARPLMAVATAGCGVAMAFSAFTIAFCIFFRLPRSCGGGGRSHRQLWRMQHPDHGPPGHSPAVLDHFQTSSGPLHHQLWLLWPHLPLQHSCFWGGDPEELQPAGHRGSAARPQGLEGGPGGNGALLPAGSHLGPGVPHPRHLLCGHALPLHHPQFPPRNLHIHLAGCPLLPKGEGDRWILHSHHQT
ncbi:adhesion G protein-coupled receptor G3 isoform 4-T4 [Guaruba guarouba]